MIDALVFAAGLGTRLRPMTDRIPKALIEVGGVPVLVRVVRRIAELGPGRIVVNAHHHADLISNAVQLLDEELDVPVLLSLEGERPLETGGGLRHAAPLFEGTRPILLHNADVITDLDLSRLVTAHVSETHQAGAQATLAVQDRPASRILLFDSAGLFGRRTVRSGREEIAREPAGPVRELAFAGIHVIQPDLVARLPARPVFSITDHYLELAAGGAVVRPFDMEDAAWWDIGTPERLESARRVLGP